MRRGIVWRSVLTLALFGLCLPVAGAENPKTPVDIHILSWTKDPTYHKRRTQKRYLGQPLGRPGAAVSVALRELRYQIQEAALEVTVHRARFSSPIEIAPFFQRLPTARVQWLLLDMPTAWQLTLTAELKRHPQVLAFNVSDAANELREAACDERFFHTLPSQRMQQDALAQYMTQRKWRDTLVLYRQVPEDVTTLATVRKTLKRFGLKTEAERAFVLERHPQKRDQNNVALLTRGDYDVVWVIDSDGEFARDVPYQTRHPRLVVGDAGLVPMAWHWSWERNGGPQLNRRFEKQSKRLMGSRDWAAWLATKALLLAQAAHPGANARALAQVLRGERFIIDGFKGGSVSFRTWNNQLRQPIFLSNGQWVIAKTPLDGFLHPSENLDTLGASAHESACHLR